MLSTWIMGENNLTLYTILVSESACTTCTMLFSPLRIGHMRNPLVFCFRWNLNMKLHVFRPFHWPAWPVQVTLFIFWWINSMNRYFNFTFTLFGCQRNKDLLIAFFPFSFRDLFPHTQKRVFFVFFVGSFDQLFCLYGDKVKHCSIDVCWYSFVGS